ncbi:MAG: hypothetical protein IJW99_12370 [Clostridia bacterium]|nr:hypothetical protein [Clostridia bacterium]
MGNLWEFLLQTLSVSLVAALLLVIKRLMEDKLSPRWQYGVWVILALRILIPANALRTVLLPLPLWVEIARAYAETGLRSAYTSPYVPISLEHVFPAPQGKPLGFTDWLFVLYAAGAVLCALWYLLSYLHLRLLLRRGCRADEALERQIRRVCEQYGLKPCRATVIRGLPSAFVCGILRPVLAVPAEREIDDKILLHELLHLKYRDAWQNSFWCALRCLHWCNPFLHWVFRRIENDMESLCDQRVLERLEGEERRAYGTILLTMANDRFARAPGSTSISNGGKNIARRIAAIVRFKKYPRGMVLVSVCIVLVLLAPTLIGAGHTVKNSDYQPQTGELERTMALTRLRRCGTVAGAIDTYAKGLLLENGTYIATAVPLSRQEELTEAMKGNATLGKPVWFYDGGDELEDAYAAEGYDVYELSEQPDGSYLCYLLFSAANSTGEGTLGDSTVVLTLRLTYDHGWCVEEVAPRDILFVERKEIESRDDVDIPFGKELTAETAHGTLTVRYRSMWQVDYTVTSVNGGFFGGIDTYMNTDINPNATFRSLDTWTLVSYTASPDGAGRLPQSNVSLKCAALSSADEKVDFPHVDLFGLNTSGGSSAGYMWGNKVISEGWDGTYSMGNGTGYTDINDVKPDTPTAFWVELYWDREVVEEVILEEVTP